MKARDSVTGTFKDVYVKALDSMPVGTIVDYDGDSIPTGWEEVNDYSTDEVNTGKKWIDSKPIYRKVITITNFSSSQLYNHNISNIDELLDIRGFAKLDGKWQPIQRVVTDAILQYGIGVGDITSSQFLLQIGANYQTKTKANIIIEYTKTTD